MMKKLLLIGSLLIQANLFSQVIPNYNFEMWSNGVNSPPDGWDDYGNNTPNVYPTSQTTDHYLGSYAVKIETKIMPTDTSRGVIFTARPHGGEGFGPAFSVSMRHNNLKGFYKYIPQNGDSAQMIIYISKTGFVNPQGWGDLLAWGQKHLGAAATYSPFSAGYLDSSANFVYFDNTLVPDSAYIEIGAYKMIGQTPGDLKPKGNSVLYIDALNFDTYITGVHNYGSITANFTLFPSVSSGQFSVEFETKTSDFTTMKIYDLNGREVQNLFSESLAAGVHKYSFEAGALKNGTYLFVAATGNGYTCEKITIVK